MLISALAIPMVCPVLHLQVGHSLFVGDQVRIVANNQGRIDIRPWNNNHHDIIARFPFLGGRTATITSKPTTQQNWVAVQVDGVAEILRVHSSNCELVKEDTTPGTDNLHFYGMHKTNHTTTAPVLVDSRPIASTYTAKAAGPSTTIADVPSTHESTKNKRSRRRSGDGDGDGDAQGVVHAYPPTPTGRTQGDPAIPKPASRTYFKWDEVDDMKLMQLVRELGRPGTVAGSPFELAFNTGRPPDKHRAALHLYRRYRYLLGNGEVDAKVVLAPSARLLARTAYNRPGSKITGSSSAERTSDPTVESRSVALRGLGVRGFVKGQGSQQQMMVAVAETAAQHQQGHQWALQCQSKCAQLHAYWSAQPQDQLVRTQLLITAQQHQFFAMEASRFQKLQSMLRQDPNLIINHNVSEPASLLKRLQMHTKTLEHYSTPQTSLASSAAGTSWLNRPLQDKYGQTFDTFIAEHATTLFLESAVTIAPAVDVAVIDAPAVEAAEAATPALVPAAVDKPAVEPATPVSETLVAVDVVEQHRLVGHACKVIYADGVKYSGNIVAYDPVEDLHEIEYEDGAAEWTRVPSDDIEIMEQTLFEVERIEGRKTDHGTVYYKVRWIGFDERTWQIAEDIPVSMISAFEKARCAPQTKLKPDTAAARATPGPAKDTPMNVGTGDAATELRQNRRWWS